MVSEPPRPRVVTSAAWIRACGAGRVRAGVRRGRCRLLAQALEAGDDHDATSIELLVDPARVDVGDPGAAVAAVRGDPRLGAGQGDRRNAERVQRHRHQRRALVLAGREEHVHLARIGFVGDRGGERDQLVGGVAHRRDDDHEVHAGGALTGDPPGDAPDAVGVGERRATEFLDDEGRGHDGAFYPRGLHDHSRRVSLEVSFDVLRSRQPPADRAHRRRRARLRPSDARLPGRQPVRRVPGAGRRRPPAQA